MLLSSYLLHFLYLFYTLFIPLLYTLSTLHIPLKRVIMIVSKK
nr:MAG TPA: hypothetical protein [Caudoviricetes sp.]